MLHLTEFSRSILIGIGAGFLSGIFLGLLDYSYARFIQKNTQQNLNELVLKSIFIGISLAILLGVMVFIELSTSSILSIAQINRSTIALAIVLPLINFVVDKFLGAISASKKAE